MNPTVRTVAALAAATLLAAGCAQDAAPGDRDTASPTATAGTSPSTTASPSPTPTASASASAEPLTLEREGHVIHEFAAAPRVVQDGVRVGTVLLAVASLDAPDVSVPLEEPDEDTETVFGLQVVVVNESGSQIAVNAADATLEVADVTAEVDTAASVPFGGEMGVDGESTGQSIWQLPVPFDDVVAAGSATYRVPVVVGDGETVDVTLPIRWDDPVAPTPAPSDVPSPTETSD